ncbi:M23 family metallopeptidase [Paenibacillus macquariensis]|uniref:Stage IV sporulation protein FA n=1 Tax=Paenibacillus macquariensis TaxID=948756 RepID=A0ABY1JTD4_9BACL|nr:M23 family metallopeptidase [Paenibacillus macquariensis]MEC0093122.1 M23 family metallopeptidase [Paenibacillus macquariensis]OAB36463.1 hypothetical protein PMSM_08500 [Paenibacillus macquariensis subsp. macquariensis]SIQ73145.1 stage IV sporulation protein FA [Paenibacillus macquariensis]
MDDKSALKQRREERIQALLDYNQSHLDTRKLSKGTQIVQEPDPEVLWKKERSRLNGFNEDGRKNNFVSSFTWRLLLSGLLFGVIVGVYRLEQPLAVNVQQYITQSLNREMDYQAAEAWYVSHFGEAPTIIPSFKESQNDPQKVIASLSLIAPIQGNITMPYSVALQGIEITPNGDSNANHPVKSVATGRVIDVVTDSLVGKTVTIRHTGGMLAIYGHLDTNLKINDWVEAGDSLGLLSNASTEQSPFLYFAIQKGQEYIDPTEVMSFD